MNPSYLITPLGDSALLVYFGNRIDEAINQKVLRLFQRLQKLSLPGITDLIPAYASLTVCYDVMMLNEKEQSPFELLKEKVEAVLNEQDHYLTNENRLLKIPVCYQKNFAPDLESLSQQKQLSPEEAIQLHTSKTYRVYMLGFLPGFAYMGKVDERIAAARKAAPVSVASGSVGIAGEQTGIYPFLSPGGWNIIGRTPVKVFDKDREVASLLQPGDEVQFYSITEDEFKNYQGGIT